MPDTRYTESLLQNNRDWVTKTLQENELFFENLALGQSPPIFWIGCSDSRVPANQITGTKAGDIFSHRNIANVVSHNDLNLLSVLEYAVNFLKVKHIIVGGHYCCGGVEAAMGNKNLGLIDHWLGNIKEVYRMNQKEVDSITVPEDRLKKMVELNAKDGIRKLGKTGIIQNAWLNNQDLQLHAWVFDVKTGILKDLNVSCHDHDSYDKIF
ncbi:carbonic anhydrase [Pseudopedobacter beijingensis]|uniref:Carbonic anhydrase n=1 Tax=Pseudopedobacter beijingensis TaxID=1207056 RepID=A0ABW4ICQ9_9SPHI